MSGQNLDKPNRYRRGNVIINGNTKHDTMLRYIDLVGSKLILILRLPGIAIGVYELAERIIEHYS